MDSEKHGFRLKKYPSMGDMKPLRLFSFFKSRWLDTSQLNHRLIWHGVTSHRTNFSNHQKAGFWSFDYDYICDLLK
ncbi:hypothetical protein GPALN_013370 [Globodera pallida]|nr:hypothetical protein GPALN_013370 [Globodera pallida]